MCQVYFHKFIAHTADMQYLTSYACTLRWHVVHDRRYCYQGTVYMHCQGTVAAYTINYVCTQIQLSARPAVYAIGMSMLLTMQFVSLMWIAADQD